MILGVVFWTAGVYHAVRVGPQVWRDPDRADRMTAALVGSPFGMEVRRGLVRGVVLNVANMFLLGSGLLFGGVWQLQGAHDGILFWVILVDLALTLVSVALGLAIIWFNVPAVLVPPHLRDEAGMVRAKLRERGRRRG